MTVNGMFAMVLLVTAAVAAIALVRHLADREQREDVGFEHWLVATPGVRPAPPTLGTVVEACAGLPWGVERAAVATSHLGQPVVAVEGDEGWAVLVRRTGPAPERMGPCRVHLGADGWSQLRLARDQHRGTAEDAMALLWQTAGPWIAGVPYDEGSARS